MSLIVVMSLPALTRRKDFQREVILEIEENCNMFGAMAVLPRVVALLWGVCFLKMSRVVTVSIWVLPQSFGQLDDLLIKPWDGLATSRG